MTAAIMTNLLLSIFCAVALVAFSNAKELSAGPQPLEDSSLSSMPQKLDKRYATQVITLFLTPSEMKALTDSKDTANLQFQIQEEKEMQQSDFQKYNEQQQLEASNQYNKMPSVVEPKAELRGLLAHNSFYPKNEKSNYENQQWNYNFANSYSEQKPKEEQKQMMYSDLIKNEPQDNLRYQEERKTQQESALEKESVWTQFVPESAIKENTALYGQIKEQGNTNIFDQNRVQLKALSTVPREYENMKETNTEYNVAKIIQLNSKNEDKSEIEKQIELILRHEQAFEEEKQRDLARAEANKQRPPIIIHKEVSVIKHLPVPVLKKVKVPTPVLVPIPEPYEVKIPHPYPVPFKVIKHIPVPVVRHY